LTSGQSNFIAFVLFKTFIHGNTAIFIRYKRMLPWKRKMILVTLLNLENYLFGECLSSRLSSGKKRNNKKTL